MSCGANDRDLRASRQASRRSAGRQALAREPRARLPEAGPAASAGALRRLTCSGHAFVSPDDPRLAAVPGRAVPIGYARYESPVVDTGAFAFYAVAGARLAVPRSTPGCHAAALLRRFYEYGPSSIGYVAIGDTYVPAILSPGDRAALAGAAPRGDGF